MLECMYSNILILQQWMLLEIVKKKKQNERNKEISSEMSMCNIKKN